MVAPSSPHHTLRDLQQLVARLRGPDGCPWDREQELKDLSQYLLEECYEVIEAISTSSLDKLEEELGDLLFHIVFMAHLAGERGAFGLEEVVEHVYLKMVRRHPHVFGDASAPDTEAVKKHWWSIKQEEGATPSSQLESVPRHLPALQRAYRLGQRASRAGLDWPGPGPVLDKVREEIAELEQALQKGGPDRIQEELGDLLFSLANFARHLKQNPEEALQESNRKFVRRFRALEQRASEQGRRLETLSPEEMDRWWEEVKRSRTA
jgi:MazG family protein